MINKEKHLMRNTLAIALMLSATLGLAACDKKSEDKQQDANKAAQQSQESMQKAQDKVNDAAKESQEAAQKNAEAAQERAKEANDQAPAPTKQ
jgi:biopolymer transport protein ExbB/TolQ